ncbi:hypothetical protein QYZ87_08035 [Porphyromonadaceae bacterium W3.11]|nr:hypothetical protein [Porphyromonadaceae bacterium W3.11]
MLVNRLGGPSIITLIEGFRLLSEEFSLGNGGTVSNCPETYDVWRSVTLA